MVTSPYQWKILEWDEQTNEQKKTMMQGTNTSWKEGKKKVKVQFYTRQILL